MRAILKFRTWKIRIKAIFSIIFFGCVEVDVHVSVAPPVVGPFQ